MPEFANVIPVALLLLVVFLIGCAIGYFLRAKISPAGANNDKAPRDLAAARVATPAAPAKQTEVKTAPDKAIKAKPARAKTVASKTVAIKSKSAGSKPTRKTPAKKVPTKKISTKKTPGKTVSTGKASTDGRPPKLDAPRGGTKDNLKLIKGIGPKIEGTLNDLGIYHFDQIASWGRESVAWVDDSLSFKGRIDRENWVAQSKKIADESTNG